MSLRQSLADRSLLLVITGGIAAYKSLDLIRRLRERGARVRCVMTAAAQNIVTADAVGAISGERVFTELWDRDAEHDIGHIRLAREADAVMVVPATANMMAQMAAGLADDLASTVLLATNSPILVAPAMNPAMWDHPATRRNIEQLAADGVTVIEPGVGEMAESGEAGTGRLADVMKIVALVETLLDDRPKPLTGKRAVVTSGPTREAIDPVRYISNHSSGKQGHAIAAALADAGADVVLVSGPVNISDPAGVSTVHVMSAREMEAAVADALPADIAIFVAAVADWRMADAAPQKMKKDGSGKFPALDMVENPDILRGVAQRKSDRPALVVGFAAETEKLEEHARAKLERKGADWIVANDVSAGVFGEDANTVMLVSRDGAQAWPRASKADVAAQLVAKIAERFEITTL